MVNGLEPCELQRSLLLSYGSLHLQLLSIGYSYEVTLRPVAA